MKCLAGVPQLTEGTGEMGTETLRGPRLRTTTLGQQLLVRGRPQFYLLGGVTFRLLVRQHHGVMLNKYQ